MVVTNDLGIGITPVKVKQTVTQHRESYIERMESRYLCMCVFEVSYDTIIVQHLGAVGAMEWDEMVVRLFPSFRKALRLNPRKGIGSLRTHISGRCYKAIVVLFKKGNSRPLFVYFHHFHLTQFNIN